MTLFLLWACTGGTGVLDPGDDSSPGGVATFSAATLVWTDLTPGFSVTRALDVTNTGEGPLDVTEATIVTDPSGVFSVEFTATTLDPAATASVVVSALLVVDEPATGQLRLRTSDPAASAPIFALTVE